MFEPESAFSGISVDDITKAHAFYSDKLGLRVVNETMGLTYSLPGGGKLFIYEKPGHEPATFTVLNFSVDDIDKAVDALVSRGVTFEHYEHMPIPQDNKGILRGLSTNHGPDIAWFLDPARNILAVLQDK